MKLYVHREGKLEPEVAEVDDATPLREALGLEKGESVLREDGDALDADAKAADAGLSDGDHVFAGQGKKVTVVVNFNGEVREEKFPPSQRVERVFRWAVSKKGFELSDEDAAEHTFAVAATGAQPEFDAHVASLPRDDGGRVVLNLIPKHRYEG
jgi:hypothetical protein